MQEHMDTMHSDIVSLGHKHDHAMTAMGEMNDNIDILTNNIGGIDSNVAALKDLILSMGKKMQPPVALPRPALVPSILLPRPGIVPSAIPHDRSSPVSRRPAPKPVIHQPHLPDRVPLGHVGLLREIQELHRHASAQMARCHMRYHGFDELFDTERSRNVHPRRLQAYLPP